jgi:copper(I)-binding protein
MTTPKSLLAAAALLVWASSLHAQPAPGLAISAAWVRPTMPGRQMTAAYMRITNPGPEPDALLGASCEEAATLELHRMAMDGGKMTMERVQQIELAPAATAELAPGGLHLMFFGVAKPLVEGQSIKLTLRFAHAAPQEVLVPVLSAAPSDAATP